MIMTPEITLALLVGISLIAFLVVILLIFVARAASRSANATVPSWQSARVPKSESSNNRRWSATASRWLNPCF